jgi:hypothetical protein
MARQGKQMRVGACKLFPYRSEEIVLLADGNMYEVFDSTLFVRGKTNP